MAAPESRSSIQHLISDEPMSDALPVEKQTPPRPSSEPNEKAVSGDGDQQMNDEEQNPNDEAQYTAITQTTRRNANGSVSSVFSGNKIRHLKKEDGIPLWRKDIQYEFLQAIFEDDKRVFTRLSDGSTGHTFAEVYIDTLAQSSKTSKILKEKLAQDHASAVTMAMVCLLVNVGRMNTTLNFFPEMRAQLRTYHSIPALQANQDPHAYKQLQDAPRLKSILKGASEDEPQPGTLEEIRASKRPRTNSVNLIFVLAQYAPKVTETHFSASRDFFDLIMRSTLSSKSRARAFLWLIWWYLESDFTAEEALANPFGAGTEGEGSGGMPVKVPPLEVLTEEQAERENVDTEAEKAFGEQKRKERIAIVASEPSPAMTALKRARKERSIFRPGYITGDGFESGTPGGEEGSPVPSGMGGEGYDSTREDSPAVPPSGAAVTLPRPGLPEEATPSRSAPGRKGPGRGNWRRNRMVPPATHDHAAASSSRAPEAVGGMAPGSPPDRRGNGILPARLVAEIQSRTSAGEVVPATASLPLPPPPPPPQSGAGGNKKLRPLTTHQLAISEFRRIRVRRILERGVQRGQTEARRRRMREGGVLRAWMRCKTLPSGWDSEEEEAKQGKEEKEEGAKGWSGMDLEGDGKLWGRTLSKTSAAVPRPVGGVWMAGFVMPGLKEVEDCGEEYGHLQRVFGRVEARVEAEGKGHQGVLLRRRNWGRRKSLVEIWAEELGKDPLDIGARPRLVRKNVGGGRGRGGRSGRTKAGAAAVARGSGGSGAVGVKAEEEEEDGDGDGAAGGGGGEGQGAAEYGEETVEMLMDGDGEGDEDEMMDVDDRGRDGQEDNAELDEEDRELLGAVDAEESDEGEDGEELEEDGEGEDGEDVVMDQS